MPQSTTPSFGALNYAMLALYFAAMLWVGWWASRRVKNSSGYFVAEGRLGSLLVGLSLLGTYLSALTMMGLPGKAFGPDDFTYTIQLPCLIITGLVITKYVLPRYRDAGSISVYELLERKIHLSCRLLASASFILFSIARMGVILYLPALAMNHVAGIPLHWGIVVMGVVMTIYTVKGGIEAVIWTEAAQVFVFVSAAIISLAYVLYHTIPGGQFGQVCAEYHKMRVWIPGTSIMKISSFWLVSETIFSTIRIYGTQQCFTQRFMATKNTKEAIKSVWVSILGYIPLAYLFYFMGVALFVYYNLNPDPNMPMKAPGKIDFDAVYPFFVVSKLPQGIAGLVIAGIFASAMSAVSSMMNANSTACVEDWYRRFTKTQHDDQHYLRVARWLSLCWGIMAIVMALLFQGNTSVVDLWIKVMGVATNGVLGLMALSFLPFRVNWVAAVIGFVASYAVLFALMETKVTFLAWTVVGNSSCFIIALVLHPLFQLFVKPKPAASTPAPAAK